MNLAPTTEALEDAELLIGQVEDVVPPSAKDLRPLDDVHPLAVSKEGAIDAIGPPARVVVRDALERIEFRTTTFVGDGNEDACVVQLTVDDDVERLLGVPPIEEQEGECHRPTVRLPFSVLSDLSDLALVGAADDIGQDVRNHLIRVTQSNDGKTLIHPSSCFQVIMSLNCGNFFAKA